MRLTRRVLLVAGVLATIGVAALTPVHGLLAQATITKSEPALVILVRHAEKATTGGADPDLSEAGQARAKALAAALGDAGVTAIVTSTFKRTVQTADPYATAHNVAVERVALDGATAAHVAAVVAAIRKHPGETVLVVGHSNTIPAIVTALGGPKLPDLCDASYATMFTVQPARAGAASGAHVVRAKYGAADPDGAETCTSSMK